MKSYRNAFLAALVASCALAVALVYGWWRYVRPQATAAVPPGMTMSERGGTGEGGASPVPAEAPLAPLQLTPERMQSIGVKTGLVEAKVVHDQLRVTGNVEFDETRLSYVQVRFPGWIQKVYADSTFQYVRKGQPLFTIYSPDLVTTEQEYLLAKQNQSLLASSSVPGVASGAASLVSSAAARLDQWQVPAREIKQLDETGKAQREVEIDSPVSGYITERNALPNLYVQPATRLYAVADLSAVWVFAQIFQTDMGRIRAGESAVVTSDAYPGRTFNGRVDFVYPEVDMSTRTVKVRLVFANPGLKLTPGMFVNVDLKIPLGRQTAIPASGVFHTGVRNIVFVDHGQGYLEPRDVTLGPGAGDEIVVLKGLKAGERVVTSANFLVDSESQLQAALGSFVPAPAGAGAAASMNASVPQASVHFSTVPTPPSKGKNAVRVTVAASGIPVTGAEVTVTFFMPAMPAMGMAAMRTVVNLDDKGSGVYEGHGELQTGGTWQVTIVARKNGQTLATKQLSVNAEGGM